MAKDMLLDGIYVVGFSYPVVPMRQARIPAAHDKSHIDEVI